MFTITETVTANILILTIIANFEMRLQQQEKLKLQL